MTDELMKDESERPEVMHPVASKALRILRDRKGWADGRIKELRRLVAAKSALVEAARGPRTYHAHAGDLDAYRADLEMETDALQALAVIAGDIEAHAGDLPEKDCPLTAEELADGWWWMVGDGARQVRVRVHPYRAGALQLMAEMEGRLIGGEWDEKVIDRLALMTVARPALEPLTSRVPGQLTFALMSQALHVRLAELAKTEGLALLFVQEPPALPAAGQ